jgi:hypothetical protein
MRRNPKLPDHLRDADTALEWAMQNGDLHMSLENIPTKIKTLDDLRALAERDWEYLGVDPDLDDYDRADFDMSAIIEANRALDNAVYYVDYMLDAEKEDGVILYRSLTAAGHKGIRFEGVGVYWAYDANCAEPHWGEYGEGHDTYVLTCVVRPENIDWEGGFVAFLAFGEEECEVRVDPGAPILITEIDGEPLDVPIEATA